MNPSERAKVVIERCGLLLLTGGQGRRLGGPKHDRPHPKGGSWGGHLVRVFRSVCPDGPVVVLGATLPDYPDLTSFDDPRLGPSLALIRWAAQDTWVVRRWWILPCDQVDWDSHSFGTWLESAEWADPEGQAWCYAHQEHQPQPLGGFLGAAIRPWVATLVNTRVRDLAAELPHCELPEPRYRGRDVDTPEDLAAWSSGLGEGGPVR